MCGGGESLKRAVHMSGPCRWRGRTYHGFRARRLRWKRTHLPFKKRPPWNLNLLSANWGGRGQDSIQNCSATRPAAGDVLPASRRPV